MGRMAYAIAELAALRLTCPKGRAAAFQAALVPPDADFSPCLKMELLENMLDVLLDGARAAFENSADVVVAFSGDDPFDDFRLASGQIRRLSLGHAREVRVAIAAQFPGGHRKRDFYRKSAEASIRASAYAAGNARPPTATSLPAACSANRPWSKIICPRKNVWRTQLRRVRPAYGLCW